jgi:RimJ/RimL family protein N-acetyltransferase
MTLPDLDTVLPIQRDGAVEGLGAVFPQDRYPFPTEAVRQRWTEEIADRGIDCFVVLDRSGEIVGFAATRNEEFLHFGTALSTWGSGIASSAHDAVLAHLEAQGHERVSLRVFEGNRRGRRFYAKHGWTPTGDRTRSAFEPSPVLLTYTRAVTVRVQRVATAPTTTVCSPCTTSPSSAGTGATRYRAARTGSSGSTTPRSVVSPCSGHSRTCSTAGCPR